MITEQREHGVHTVGHDQGEQGPMVWTASDFERLDPRLFRSLLAVVKTQSFSAAADEAALTQGAVSQQIAKLEERLNTQLFVRAGTRVILTSSGQLLAQYAKAY